MKRKALGKVLGTGLLALSLALSPAAGSSAFAAIEDPAEENEPAEGAETEENEPAVQAETADVKEGGEKLDLDPTQDTDITIEGTDGGESTTKEAYADVEIPVWAFTEDATVYSVDVEWGAMTFEYELSSWDPATHTKQTGGGWKIYDSTTDKVVKDEKGADVTEDAINEIKVTNHSNAGVWATLTYAGETGHTDTDGAFSFTKGTEATDTDVLTAAAADKSVPAYLTLKTADNNGGEGEGVGKETIGKAYFMPVDIGQDDKTNGITKWTTIGKITVGIKTAQPGTEDAEEGGGDDEP